MHSVLAPAEENYMKRYREKHGKEYGEATVGVAAAKMSELAKFKNNWQCILELLEA